MNDMRNAGKIIDDILRCLKKEKRSVKRVSIKDTFGLDDEKIDGILKLLRDLKLIELDNQISITKSGLEFLQL